MKRNEPTSLPPAHVLLDSTLRDGEQAPGVALSPDEKARYVEMAEEAGIRYIEIGFPHNPFDYEACREAARAAREARLVAMALTKRESIDRVIAVGAHEVLFIVPCSESHLSAIFGGTQAELSEQLLDAISHARDNGLAINVGLEDASQGDMHVIRRLLEDVRRHGVAVDCVTVADSRGQLLPSETQALVGAVYESARGLGCRLAFHAHNDLGLATANSLAALTAATPVDCVHVTSCGFGERAGNASLEQMAVLFEAKLELGAGIDLKKVVELTRFVQDVFLTPIHTHAPVIGSKVFLHESGIHQKAMLNESRTFQFLDPQRFGRSADLILGKHSGKRLREEIARQAGCREEDVCELQRALLSIDKQRIKEVFTRAARAIYEQNFIGLSQGEAVEALRGSGGPGRRPR